MIAPEITQINSLEVASYLVSKGWEATKSRRPNINLFTIERGGNQFEITLPMSRNFKDYSDAVHNVVEQIAEVEERPLSDVVTQLLTFAVDVVKFRRADINTQNGTIPFDEGLRLFKNAKKALYVVVCDLLEPKLYHKKLRLKAADAFIKRCSFGQTERGSYVATILCPFSQADQPITSNQLTLFDPIPNYADSFTRQVTSRLMRSLNQVHLAIERDQLNNIQQVDNPADIISGNLLEALLELNGSTNSAEIEVSAQWAAIAPMPEDVAPASVRFRQNDFTPIAIEVERIQSQNEPKSRPGVFIGRISLIQTDPDIDQRKNGEVILNTIDTDGKLIKPRLVVSPDELSLVMQAMKDGSNVRVKGVLTSHSNKKALEYTSLELID